eukprot:358041-Chlamydomonas_euryale.AAC.4
MEQRPHDAVRRRLRVPRRRWLPHKTERAAAVITPGQGPQGDAAARDDPRVRASGCGCVGGMRFCGPGMGETFLV